jgi:hypothetical protein
VAAPLLTFAFLYALTVVPARRATAAAQAEAMTAQAALLRARASARNTPGAAAGRVLAPTAADLAGAVRNIACGPSLGGVEQFSVDIDGRTVSATFDARYTQLGEFFSGLDLVDGAYDLKSVDIEPAAAAPLVRATVILQVRGPLTPDA